jgi:propanol-preferring alcohol dehydrogenase
MRAMVLEAPGRGLVALELPDPRPGPGQVLIEVAACGVCRTDLHVVDGDLPFPGHRVVPGHEVVGTVVSAGPGASRFRPGDRIGIPWLGWTCGECAFCRSGRENLCGRARFTGYHLDGGYASRMVADERFAFPIPAGFGDAEAAPLLCAGLIGYRSWKPVREARRLGIYGFGAAGHIVAQLARHAGQEVFAFTRRDGGPSVDLARRLGAAWVGTSAEPPPEPLDAAILFAPAGELVPAALRAVERGGTVVCAGIHMTDIPAFPYSLLWGERSVRSVANLTRADGDEFLDLAARIPVRTEVTTLPLERASEALQALRSGQLAGAAVLVP